MANKKNVKTRPEQDQRVTGIMISKDQLKEYKIVGENHIGHTLLLPVANVGETMEVINREGLNVYSTRAGSEGQQLYKNIVNLRAVAQHNVPAIRVLFEEKDEIDLGELQGLLMSCNTRPYLAGLAPELPMFGGQIKAIISKAPSSTRAIEDFGAPEETFVVTSFQVPKAEEAPGFSFEEEELEVPADEKVEQ